MVRLLTIICCFSIIAVKGQTVNLITSDELEQRINSNADTTYIVNFWATWCGPCVKELPHFQKLRSELKNEPVSILLVSLDSKSKLETQVKSFAKRRKLKNEVFLLDEPNLQEYMDKIDRSWSGTIPATLFVFHKRRKFMEQTFSYSELLEAYHAVSR